MSRWERFKEFARTTARNTIGGAGDEFRLNKTGLALAAGFIIVAVVLIWAA